MFFWAFHFGLLILSKIMSFDWRTIILVWSFSWSLSLIELLATFHIIDQPRNQDRLKETLDSDLDWKNTSHTLRFCKLQRNTMTDNSHATLSISLTLLIVFIDTILSVKKKDSVSGVYMLKVRLMQRFFSKRHGSYFSKLSVDWTLGWLCVAWFDRIYCSQKKKVYNMSIKFPYFTFFLFSSIKSFF